MAPVDDAAVAGQIERLCREVFGESPPYCAAKGAASPDLTLALESSV
jgi:hypothetical protein